MSESILLPPANNSSAVIEIEGVVLPILIERAGEKTARRFLEYFTAEISNDNTRFAYGRTVRDFLDWCAERDVELHHVEPILVAGYIKKLLRERSAPTVKQHLAAIRMLFDYLVAGQVLPYNPAAAVRGPKHSVKKGKTPVLNEEEARTLLDSIDVSSIVGLRDRAILVS